MVLHPERGKEQKASRMLDQKHTGTEPEKSTGEHLPVSDCRDHLRNGPAQQQQRMRRRYAYRSHRPVRGFTEPDPRDDLSGMDVARKTVILAREIGSPVELGDFVIQSLVPSDLRDVSREEFLSRLNELDDDMKKRYEKAKSEGKCLRYIGCVNNGKCSVSLTALPLSHPFAQAGGTDNIIAFTTSRYNEEQPLVIKGPGAGPAVTAGGVFSDLIRLSVYLGAGLI